MKLRVNLLCTSIGGICLFFTLSCLSPSQRIEVDFRPSWDSTRVLINPLKGWYHHIIDNGIHRYTVSDDSIFQAFPGMDHLYIRLAWSFLEPEEGKYDWSLIEEVIDKYVPQGYGISFRITSKERGPYPTRVAQKVDNVNYATPYWVREAGAQGKVSLSRNSEGIYAWSPDWDDPVYLEKLDNFHRAFAERYDAEPWMRYVDVGSIGDYGEGHTSPSTKIPPTVEEVKANLNIYLKHYKNTQIVVPDALLFWHKSEEDTRTLFEYARDQGITVRDDSPLFTFHLNEWLDTWSISHPHFYDPLYKERFTVLELQHYHALKRDSTWIGKNGNVPLPKYPYTAAQIFRGAIETMHATYLGYHGYVEEFWRDNPELTGEYLNLCGYWYFPVKADLPQQFEEGNNDWGMTWLNKGVAPAYKPFELVMRFSSHENPDSSFEVVLPDAHNQTWLPSKESTVRYSFAIPAEVSKGRYKVSIKLQYQKEAIDLGVEEGKMDGEGFMEIASMEIN